MMRHIFSTTILTGLIALSGGVLAAGGHSDAGDGHAHGNMAQGPISSYRELTADEVTIQGVLDTYGRAMEQKSVEIMEQAVIPDDFSTIESGYPNWTWADFRDNHLLLEMDTFTDVDYDIGLILGEFQGSLGFALYQYTASGMAAERKVSISGLGTAILEKTDAGWRIHHLHTSAPRNQLEAAEG